MFVVHPRGRQEPRPPRTRSHAPTLIAVGLVLACTTALLLTGHPLTDALLGACGLALTGNEVARRILADAGPLPVIIAAAAVAAFGAVLVVRGATLAQAAMGAGIAGLLAGEMAGRMFGSIPQPWKGV